LECITLKVQHVPMILGQQPIPLASTNRLALRQWQEQHLKFDVVVEH